MRIQLTEHVAGVFKIKCPSDGWLDYDVTDEMLIGYFKCKGGFIDEPKIFDLPADDIRNSLPEWNPYLPLTKLLFVKKIHYNFNIMILIGRNSLLRVRGKMGYQLGEVNYIIS